MPAPLSFPDPRNSTEEGLVALGGNLSVETLLTAYRLGIFPWPIEGLPLPWFCPPERGVLFFDEIRLNKRLRLYQKTSPFRFSINGDFSKVIHMCSKVPRLSPEGTLQGTWITPAMKKAYIALHEAGFALSAEAWEGDHLVGGIYGVFVDHVFSGESMFHIKPNASKLVLLHLVEHLKSLGLKWIDIQMLTPHMKALGARSMDRDEFLSLLKRSARKA